MCTHQRFTAEPRCSPQDVPLVEIEQNVVALEFSLTGTEDAPAPQVLVHLLQTLQTLGHVLIVDLGIKGGHGFLTHEVGTVDVKPRALFN